MLVGVAGIEPATPRSQSECATAAPHPDSAARTVIGTKQPDYCRTVNADSHNPICPIIDELCKFIVVNTALRVSERLLTES